MDSSIDGDVPVTGQMRPVNMSAEHGLSDIRQSPLKQSPKFPYKPLSMDTYNFDQSEIRLLILKPGPSSCPIECNVQNLPIAEARSLKFRALSYTWGPPEKTEKIVLEGIQVDVRENLWQALYHLRSPETEMCLWIDALCVNQDDGDEKNSQVSMMGLIYSEAVEVVVWLGPGCSSSKLGMEFLQFLEKSPVLLKTQLPIEIIAGSTALFEALEHLMERDYWKRTWIIQEVLMASQLTIHCGYQTLRWETLVKFFTQIRDTVFEPAELLNMSPDPLQPRLVNLCQSLPARLTQHTRSQERSLEELLETYKDSLSSDPRDKIYSLLGLAEGRLCRASMCSGGTSLQEPTSRSVSPTLSRDPSSVSRAFIWNDCVPIDYSISELELFRILAVKFSYEDPWSSRQVRRMKLLQETLGLQPPGLDIHSNVNLVNDNTALSLAQGCVTALGQSYSRVSDCSLFRYQNSRIRKTNWEKIWLWHDAQLISPWLRQCLENAHDENLKRLDIDPCTWDTAGFQVFLDTRGYIGLGRSSVRVGDKIVQFCDSGIALIVRGSMPAVVIGRALFLSPEAEKEVGPRTEEYITLPLDRWRCLIW